jgi:O-antigen ligase
MRKSGLLLYLKVLIFLVPLPFGCVGPVFSPVFYFLLILFAFLVNMTDLQELNLGRRINGTRPTHGRYSPGKIYYQVHIKLFLYLFTGFLIFQILPLPEFILKTVSPNTVEMLIRTQGSFSGWHSISLVPAETFGFLIRFAAVGFFMLALFRIYLTKKEIFSLFNFIFLSAFIQTLFGLMKYLSGSTRFFLLFHEIPDKARNKFLTGTLGNSNHFAFWLEMVIPLILAFFFLRIRFLEGRKSIKDNIVAALNESWQVMLYLIMIMTMGAAVIFTGSRVGMLILLLIFVFFAKLSLYFKWSKAVRSKLKYIFIIIGIVIVFLGAQDTLNKSLNTNFEQAGRFLRWPNTLRMVGDFPVFGTGLGTYKYAFYPYDTSDTGRWSTHAHNDFLEILSEGGILGLLLVLALIGYSSASMAKMWARRRHPQIKMVGIGVMCSLFAVIFHSIFDFSLRIPSSPVFTCR